MATFESRVVTIAIDRDLRAVYDFVHVPGNFPLWASGLAAGLEPAGEDWIAQGPEGEVRIRFSPPNPFGVLDHVVVLGDGTEIHSPMRVIANGTGSEVMFTLFRRPGMTPEAFAADAEWVARDLQALKEILERPTSEGGSEP